MVETAEQFKKRLEQIIDTIELHTVTKPENESKRALIDTYKSLYTLMFYFERMIQEGNLPK